MYRLLGPKEDGIRRPFDVGRASPKPPARSNSSRTLNRAVILQGQRLMHVIWVQHPRYPEWPPWSGPWYSADVGPFGAQAVMPQPQHTPDCIQQTRWSRFSLVACYTCAFAYAIQYTPEFALLHGSMPFMVLRHHGPSACCSVGKSLTRRIRRKILPCNTLKTWPNCS